MIFCRLIDSIVRNQNVGIFLLMSLVLLFVECGRDDVDYPTDYRYVEILTVLKNDKGMILEKVGVNDEETIKMTTNQWVDADLERGRRVIAEYSVEADKLNQRPMPIKLHQMGYIQFDTVKYQPKSVIENGSCPKIEIISLWRTGRFINLQSEVGYDGKSQLYTIVADKMTAGQAIVECYLQNKGELVGDNSIYRHSYASFYIGEIWDSPTLERVRLYLPSSGNEKYYIDIVKNSY